MRVFQDRDVVENAVETLEGAAETCRRQRRASGAHEENNFCIILKIGRLVVLPNYEYIRMDAAVSFHPTRNLHSFAAGMLRKSISLT